MQRQHMANCDGQNQSQRWNEIGQFIHPSITSQAAGSQRADAAALRVM